MASGAAGIRQARVVHVGSGTYGADALTHNDRHFHPLFMAKGHKRAAGPPFPFPSSLPRSLTLRAVTVLLLEGAGVAAWWSRLPALGPAGLAYLTAPPLACPWAKYVTPLGLVTHSVQERQ